MVHIGLSFYSHFPPLSCLSFWLLVLVKQIGRTLPGLASSCAWTRSVMRACTHVGKIWTCDVLLFKLLFINISVHVKCAEKQVRKEEVQRESLGELSDLDLAASSSASFAVSAVSYRQIQTCKWPLLSNCPLLWAFSKLKTLGSSSTLSRILLFLVPRE